jgi:hypothetical protein
LGRGRHAGVDPDQLILHGDRAASGVRAVGESRGVCRVGVAMSDVFRRVMERLEPFHVTPLSWLLLVGAI